MDKRKYNKYKYGRIVDDCLDDDSDRYVKISKKRNKNNINLGRNDQCSCGSGLKYKNCCMKKNRNRKNNE